MSPKNICFVIFFSTVSFEMTLGQFETKNRNRQIGYTKISLNEQVFPGREKRQLKLTNTDLSLIHI